MMAFDEITVVVRDSVTEAAVPRAMVVLNGREHKLTDGTGVARFPHPFPRSVGEIHEFLIFRGMEFKPFLLSVPHTQLVRIKTFAVLLEGQLPPPAMGIGWGLRAIGANASLSQSLDRVTVGILDTGIDASHPCLNVIDGFDSGNHAYPFSRPISPHGTFTAGLIGGIRIGDKGIVGVAPGVALLDIRVFDTAGIGASRDAICKGVRWAISRDVQILYVGFGSEKYCETEEHIWREAHDAGIVVVTPTGNTMSDNKDVLYPARYFSTICVAACGRKTDLPPYEQPILSKDGAWFLPSFSRRGPEVDVVAPGVAVCSIVPGQPGGKTLYDHCSGTSEAAAFVTGVVARILAAHPEIKNARSGEKTELVRALLHANALPLGITGTGAGLCRLSGNDTCTP